MSTFLLAPGCCSVPRGLLPTQGGGRWGRLLFLALPPSSPPGERAEGVRPPQTAADSGSRPVSTWLLLPSDSPQRLVRKAPCRGCRTAQWPVSKGRSPTGRCQPQGSRGRRPSAGGGPHCWAWESSVESQGNTQRSLGAKRWGSAGMCRWLSGAGVQDRPRGSRPERNLGSKGDTCPRVP